jgi:hypothetical protein
MPFGYSDNRESFPTRTAMVFDPLAATEVAAQLTISSLLQHERAARLIAFHTQEKHYPGLEEVIERLLDITWRAKTPGDPRKAAVARVVERVAADRLMALASNREASSDVRAVVTKKLKELHNELQRHPRREDGHETAHRELAAADIRRFLTRPYNADQLPQPLPPPPGSPIGRY